MSYEVTLGLLKIELSFRESKNLEMSEGTAQRVGLVVFFETKWENKDVSYETNFYFVSYARNCARVWMCYKIYFDNESMKWVRKVEPESNHEGIYIATIFLCEMGFKEFERVFNERELNEIPDKQSWKEVSRRWHEDFALDLIPAKNLSKEIGQGY